MKSDGFGIKRITIRHQLLTRYRFSFASSADDIGGEPHSLKLSMIGDTLCRQLDHEATSSHHHHLIHPRIRLGRLFYRVYVSLLKSSQTPQDFLDRTRRRRTSSSTNRAEWESGFDLGNCPNGQGPATSVPGRWPSGLKAPVELETVQGWSTTVDHSGQRP